MILLPLSKLCQFTINGPINGPHVPTARTSIMPQVKLKSPWSGGLQPLSVGYFKGRTRVMVLLCVLAIVKETGIDLSEAQKLLFQCVCVCVSCSQYFWILISKSLLMSNFICLFHWGYHIKSQLSQRWVDPLEAHPKLHKSIQRVVAQKLQLPSKKDELLGNFKLSVRGSIRKAPNVVSGPHFTSVVECHQTPMLGKQKRVVLG